VIELVKTIENFDDGSSIFHRKNLHGLDERIHDFEERLGRLDGVKERTWGLCCAMNEFFRYQPPVVRVEPDNGELGLKKLSQLPKRNASCRASKTSTGKNRSSMDSDTMSRMMSSNTDKN
jgi:hypothetical protein